MNFTPLFRHPLFLVFIALSLTATGRAQFIVTTAGAQAFGVASNWSGNTINGVFSHAPDGPQTITFGAGDLSPGVGLTFALGSTAPLNLESDGTADKTLTLGGDIIMNGVTTSPVTIGSAVSNNGLHVDLGGTRTFDIATGNNLTLRNNVSGTAGATKLGAGTLRILGSFNPGGSGTSVTTGVFQIGDGMVDGTVSGNISTGSGAMVMFFPASSSRYSGVISGAGNVRKDGSNVLVLDNLNTYSGGTFIDNGTLRTETIDNVLPSTGQVLVNTGATLDLTTNQTLSDISGLGTTQIAATKTLTLSNSATNTPNYDGVIAGSGAVAKTGAGSFNLVGANTYTGGTTISGGTLNALNASGSATGTGAITIDSGAWLQIGGGGGGVGSVSGNITNNGGVSFMRSDDVTYAGTITGSGTVVKSGAGKLTLSADNSFSGDTTVVGGILQIGAGGASGAIGGNASVNSGATLSFNRNDTITYVGVLSGTGSFHKEGTGTLILGAANNFDGTASIKGGTLSVGVANVLTKASVDVQTGAIFDVASDTTIGTLSGAGTTTVATGKTLTVAMSGTLAGVVSGAGGLRKDGATSLAITGEQTYTGLTTVADGTLAIGNNGTTGSVAGDIQLDAMTSNLIFSRTNSHAHSGAIMGSGSVIHAGGGILTLSGSNSYTGTTTIASGMLQIGAADTLPTTTSVSMSSGTTLDVANNQTIGGFLGSLSDSIVTIAGGRTFTISSAPGVISSFAGTITGSGDMVISGSSNGGLMLTGNATPNSITINPGALLDVGGGTTGGSIGVNVINNGLLAFNRADSRTHGAVISGTGAVKVFGGNTTLTGANSYGGGTHVMAGKLIASNSSGSATGTGTVTVNGGAVFGGSGTITGALVLNPGGRIAPGLQTGMLTVGSTTFGNASVLEFDINDASGTAGTNWDLLSISGNLAVTATNTSPFTVSLTSLTASNTPGLVPNFNATQAYSWEFVSATGSITGFSEDAFKVDPSGFQNSLAGAFFVSQSGNALFLDYVPGAIPEPSTWLLMVSGAAMVASRLVRRRKIRG